jgi:Icc-related predicted phosphoesterase
MKILCVSDHIDPLVYSTSVKERYKNVDLILAAGDLPMEYVEFIVSALNKPVYFVFGNHNLDEYGFYHRLKQGLVQSAGGMEALLLENNGRGATYVGFKTAREGKLLIAGASGSIEYNNGLNQFTNRQMWFRLLRMAPRLLINRLLYGRYVDIFLTHAPPAGIHDKEDPCHRGFDCYLWFMRVFKPRWLIHGHIHLYDLQDLRVSQYQDTTVINAYSHYILDTGDAP